jgi:ribosomal-protein-alanine N-acetyltransferase
MSYQSRIFNAYTGINPWEKSAMIKFLCNTADHACQRDVEEALDYALKRKPSFGGYVLAAFDQKKILAAIVVNRTGMEGYSPDNICVFVGFDNSHPQAEEILQHLMEKAISQAKGDLAMHVAPNNPILNLYQKLGFHADYLELRTKKVAI